MSEATPKPKPTPAEALEKALAALLKAAITFAEESPTHCHQTMVGDYRLHYTAGELASVRRV